MGRRKKGTGRRGGGVKAKKKQSKGMGFERGRSEEFGRLNSSLHF